jgi:prepilin-type processing-associated H-X9-DG protein
MTRTEVLFVVLVWFVMVAVFLVCHAASKRRAERVECAYSLKQLDIAMRIWEGDNKNQYPMAVSVTNGGAMELVAKGNAAACFLAMTNYLATTSVLVCPADKDRFPAYDFAKGFDNSHLSYFVNPEASEVYPQMVMFGDSNLATNDIPVKSGLLEYTSRTSLSWTAARHHFCGNVAFADGSVAEESNSTMTNTLPGMNALTNYLAIP